MHAILNRKMLKKMNDTGKWDEDFIKYVAGNLNLIIAHDAFMLPPDKLNAAIAAILSKQALTSDGGDDDDNGLDFGI
ncbi:hypothetical protein [Marinobacterium sp. MBR-109]|jgi:hypothetical protein|uniref:hypothetical protein n=1 Tax=Marinobacterium sp. MBR-109 TaxID=3156462 RepID=UPI00339082FD